MASKKSRGAVVTVLLTAATVVVLSKSGVLKRFGI